MSLDFDRFARQVKQIGAMAHTTVNQMYDGSMLLEPLSSSTGLPLDQVFNDNSNVE